MSLDSVFKTVRETIDKGHWQVMLIGSAPEQPQYAYTVGLTANFDHPEIVMSGLPTELMRQLINDIGDKIKGGEKMVHGDLHHQVVQGMAVRFIDLTPSSIKKHFMVANVMSEHVTMMQCVWPDKEGVLPHDSTEEQTLFSPFILN